MNFEDLGLLGLEGGTRIRELRDSCSIVPDAPGVYVVARPSGAPVEFRSSSTGGHYKGRNPTVSVAKLNERWLAAPRVLYIGRARGTSKRSNLRARLHSYMRFGLDEPCAHWGGRYIWQLADAAQLFMYWRTTSTEQAASVERELLIEFRRCYGRLPFANLRG